MDTYAVIDFETTGMTPAQGARATEVAAVLVRGDEIVGQFSSLMGSDAWVPPFIERLTGISNAMIRSAPPAAEVMREVSAFTAGCGLVAHNASFDRHFWIAERQWAGCHDAVSPSRSTHNPYAPCAAPEPAGDPARLVVGPYGARTPRRVRATPDHQPPVFACTLLLARRLYPDAPNHKLGTLAAWQQLPDCGQAHRALADALTTAHLLIRMQRDLRDRHPDLTTGLTIDHALLVRLQRTQKGHLEQILRSLHPHSLPTS